MNNMPREPGAPYGLPAVSAGDRASTRNPGPLGPGGFKRPAIAISTEIDAEAGVARAGRPVRDAGAPPTVGRHVILRDVTQADFEFLYGICTGLASGYRWRDGATCDAWPPSELSLAEVPATGPGNAASSASSSLLCGH